MTRATDRPRKSGGFKVVFSHYALESSSSFPFFFFCADPQASKSTASPGSAAAGTTAASASSPAGGSAATATPVKRNQDRLNHPTPKRPRKV